jgi:hypothetical protein
MGGKWKKQHYLQAHEGRKLPQTMGVLEGENAPIAKLLMAAIISDKSSSTACSRKYRNIQGANKQKLYSLFMQSFPATLPKRA